MKALFLACSDGRITDPLAALQQELGESDADCILMPGGPLLLRGNGMERRVALDCIRIHLELHGNPTIYLVSHQECGAYERALGGLGFDQQELLARDLRRARTLLENSHPGIDVHSYIIPWRENGRGPGFGPAERVE
jgi:carbonic anhydrase